MLSLLLVTVHSVHSNALRDAQKSCFAWFRAATLGFSVNFVHKKHLAECYQWTVTVCHDTKGNGERIKLICVYFVRYCKYDILQGKMSKSVEISRLHKDLKKMWIGELIGRKFSTFKNMKKCWKIKLCTKLSTLSTWKSMWMSWFT